MQRENQEPSYQSMLSQVNEEAAEDNLADHVDQGVKE
jgi:hypothetical protein